MRTTGDSVTEAAGPEGELDGTAWTPGTGVVTGCRRRVTSAVTELTISWSCWGVIAEAGARGAAVAGRGELDGGTVVVVPEARGAQARWERRAGGTATDTRR
ncbi:Hypothetical predicted protein [Paramuricea clavata]|uniref:Uncharacterized protein n=1 Tax=Paramuricea clavata TaxID=317549 RepID=A0A7D9EM04_PARCT|nr:Hypothetical predicted protein [Paramuricea clavata]